MDTGRDFLKAQVNNCIAQHSALLDSLKAHANQADDPRYRQLCEQSLTRMTSHQTMLEEYANSIDAHGGSGIKNAIGIALGKARDAVDALRETDWLRVVGDIVMIRQAQDTFATFARAGERLGEQRLAELGRMGEQEHDEMQRTFNAYAAELFADHVNGTATLSDNKKATAHVTK